MEIIGIICEYNPFHNGHIYHIKKIKELYPDSLLILVLNGYFLERGEISIISKENKTKIALEYGIDIIVEFPAIFGTQSADYFAYKSVEILNNFKVQRIIFGSESNDIESLAKIAKKQLNSSYQENVKTYLNQGINYPTALAKALNIDFDFNNPNDLLGISYIKAILQINKEIKYETIRRTSDYHDLNSTNEVISASNIRHKLIHKEDISTYLPTISLNSIEHIDYSLLFKLLKYKINISNNLGDYLDIDEGIENRIIKYINDVDSIDELIEKIKTKRYTYNRINRMLIHILLDFKKEDNTQILDYIKILGFNSNGQDYINKIKKDINIPLKAIYDSKTYKIERKAIILYNIITNSNTEFDEKNKPIIKTP